MSMQTEVSANFMVDYDKMVPNSQQITEGTDTTNADNARDGQVIQVFLVINMVMLYTALATIMRAAGKRIQSIFVPQNGNQIKLDVYRLNTFITEQRFFNEGDFVLSTQTLMPRTIKTVTMSGQTELIEVDYDEAIVNAKRVIKTAMLGLPTDQRPTTITIGQVTLEQGNPDIGYIGRQLDVDVKELLDDGSITPLTNED